MKRVALVVGAERYQNLDNLPGATIDARSIYKILTNHSYGNYDVIASKLVESPTLEEFRRALEAAIFEIPKLDVFTLTFSGHGVSHRGSYFLCPCDFRPDRISTSAFPISSLFQMLNEARPCQSNIIIDACNAGGLMDDLSSLLKPEALGNAASPGISLLASAMRDQVALEDTRGGLATQCLLSRVSGEIQLLGTWEPYLDLVTIGRSVSEVLGGTSGQTPVVWGINLTGMSTFTRNPHFKPVGEAASVPVGSSVIGQATFSSFGVIGERLWETYVGLKQWDEAASLADELEECLDGIVAVDGSTKAIIPLLYGLCESFPARAAQGQDRFAEVETLGVCALVGLKYYVDESGMNDFFEKMLRKLLDLLQNLLKEIVELSEHDNYSLVVANNGPAEFYLLPVRLAKLLGWIGFADLLKRRFDDEGLIREAAVSNLIEKIVDSYGGSILSISEGQAAFIHLYMNAVSREEMSEIYYEPFRLWIFDFFYRKGQVLKEDASGAIALKYLLASVVPSYDDLGEHLARPTELGSVIMFWSWVLNMEDEVDGHMEDIDHHPISIFIPESLASFGGKLVESGVVVSMEVGSDTGNGIFVLQDFKKNFSYYCRPRIAAIEHLDNVDIALVAALGSLLRPDRVAWFLGRDAETRRRVLERHAA